MTIDKVSAKPEIIESSADSAGSGLRPLLLDRVQEVLERARERLLDEKSQDALTAPGFAAAFDPDEAESMGAFAETALTEQEAIESAVDLPAARI